MKKIITLAVSLIMLCAYFPVSANPITEISSYFEETFPLKAQGPVTHRAQSPNVQTLPAPDDPPGKQKQVEPKEDLTAYFDDNERISATGLLSEFERKQQELAAYIKNCDWRTKKNLSKRDRAFVSSLINLGKLALMWADLAGLDGIMDSLESWAHDKDDNRYASAKEAFSVANDIFEAVNGEDHAIDNLYVKIQHNAFFVVLINAQDFKKVATKYPEVAYLFDDLYTYFRWRYEMRVRDSDYALNEDNINVVFRTATYINSFLGWWELANVVKSEMALAATHPGDNTSLIPFTSRNREEERNNIKGIFGARARSARYFGRVWNNMQDYAAKERNMMGIPDEEQTERGIDSVPSPVRGRKMSVRRNVFNALEPLSDQEVYQAFADMRTHYVDVRMRSERIWQQYMREHIEPLIKQPAPPAWKEAPQAGKPKFTVEDFLSILNMGSNPGDSGSSSKAVDPDTTISDEQNAEEAAEEAVESENAEAEDAE